jgi:hypothetical protein
MAAPFPLAGEHWKNPSTSILWVKRLDLGRGRRRDRRSGVGSWDFPAFAGKLLLRGKYGEAYARLFRFLG